MKILTQSGYLHTVKFEKKKDLTLALDIQGKWIFLPGKWLFILTCPMGKGLGKSFVD